MNKKTSRGYKCLFAIWKAKTGKHMKIPHVGDVQHLSSSARAQTRNNCKEVNML